MIAFKIISVVLLTFTAIGLLCAVGIAFRRDPVRIGRLRPPPVDPFFHPFGEMPTMPPRNFLITPEELSDARQWRKLFNPAEDATSPGAGSGQPSVLSGNAAARNSLRIVRGSSDVR